MENVFQEIQEERRRQDAKFGKQQHHPIEWIPILGEEVGEVNKAALEAYFGYDGSPMNYSEYRKELVQVAAVAVAMVQDIDRRPEPFEFVTKSKYETAIRQKMELQNNISKLEQKLIDIGHPDAIIKSKKRFS